MRVLIGASAPSRQALLTGLAVLRLTSAIRLLGPCLLGAELFLNRNLFSSQISADVTMFVPGLLEWRSPHFDLVCDRRARHHQHAAAAPGRTN